jgi:dihydropteroate synthase type 2
MGFTKPKIFGVVNISEDSFSEGGHYLDPRAAIERALDLARDGADAIDLGAASSNPDAKPVAADEEIRRLAPVIDALSKRGIAISIDTFKPEVQRYAIERGAEYINDIRGFPEAEMYPELARARTRLIVMHSIQRGARATREESDASAVLAHMREFFDARIGALTAAGVGRDRIIIDPGMGYFLGSNPEPSLLALRALGDLKARFGVPVLVSVSRKSFLGSITGRDAGERGAATLAAELYAALHSANYIRTHEVRALADALKVLAAIEDAKG